MCSNVRSHETVQNVHKFSKTSEPALYNSDQDSIITIMQERMKDRQKEWDEDIINLRSDFFKNINMREQIDEVKMNDKVDTLYDVENDKKFRLSFDLTDYEPNEISVNIEDKKLIVHAKHTELDNNKELVREFKRCVDLPVNVDSQRLRSKLSKDKLLTIEADVNGEHSFKLLDYKSDEHRKAKDSQNNKETKCYYVKKVDGSSYFRLIFFIGSEFSLSDIDVKTVDNKLCVSGRLDKQAEGRTSKVELSREIELPASVDANLITAHLTKEGYLVFEAPILEIKEVA